MPLSLSQQAKICQQYYNQYAPKIESMLMNHAPRHDVPDLKQEIFLKVYQGLAHFRGESSPYTWIYQIARHTLYHYYAKKRKEKDVFELNEAFLQQGSLEQKTVEKLCQTQQLLHDSYKKIENLPENLGTPLMLYLSGNSYEAIAKHMDCEVDHVRSRLYRAREVLKK